MEHVFFGHSTGNFLTKPQCPEVRKKIILKARCKTVEDLVRKQEEFITTKLACVQALRGAVYLSLITSRGSGNESELHYQNEKLDQTGQDTAAKNELIIDFVILRDWTLVRIKRRL